MDKHDTFPAGWLCTALCLDWLHGPDGTLYTASPHMARDANNYPVSPRFECMPRADGHVAYMRDAFGVEVGA